MGIVLRAFDDKLHRVVAIKVMAPQLAATSPPRKRFLREARAAAAIRHEHVVDIHAVEEEPIPYLVMEYVPGENLQQKLDRVGPLEVPEVLRIGEQIARGLAAAHTYGLIHRDIKPANILLESGVDQRVKITDFGLARAADDASLTQSGMIAGTPMYMAPEQAQGETTDHRADLFSLGSVMYAMCTGRPPFRASSSLAVLKRVAEDTPRPIREIIPEVPQWLCDIIAKLQAKKPADRFQTAQEVADLLNRCVAELRQQGQVISVGQAATVAEEMLSNPPEAKSAVGCLAPSNRMVPGKHPWGWAAVLVLLLLGGLSFTEATGVTNVRGTVIRLFTGDGTLIVEVNDPAVKVTIEGDGGLVITGAGPHEVRLRPGSYKLQAAKDGKPIQLDQELVTITRGDKQVVRVAVEPNGLAESVRPTFVTPWSDSDDWIVEGQELIQPDDSQTDRLLLFGDPRWTDYNFEAEVKIIEVGGGDVRVGLLFRASGRQNQLHAYLMPAIKGVREKGERSVLSWNGKFVGILSAVPGEITIGRWYRMRIEARGNTFKFFLDGKRLASAYNEDFPRGCVGLSVCKASARFRNLKVTDPDGKVLLEGVQMVLPKSKKSRAFLEVEETLRDAVRLKPGNAEARFALGRFHAKWGEWKEAAAAFDRGLELDSRDHSLWCHTALLHLLAGDDEGYSRVCREMIRRFGNTDDRFVAERTVKVCLLRAGAISDADFDRLQKLAVYAVTGPKDGFYHYYARSKAFADYRAGRYAQAITSLESLAPDPNGGPVDMETFAILAMAQHRLGQTAKAQTTLARATVLMNKMPNPGQGQTVTDWWGWGVTGTIYRQADELVRKKQ
jgi:tetratricopeptide (TPR) repeat protein